MSVLFNIADKIIFGNTVPDYATFRKRVLADGGTITDEAQLRADMEWVWRYKPSWFASPAVRKVDVLYGAPDLDGTVVRATTKTGINSDGTIGSRVAGELPWSYKDGRISFLPESARTNLLGSINDLANSSYFTINLSSVTPVSGTPFPHAFLLTDRNGETTHNILRSDTVGLAGFNFYEFYIKRGTKRKVILQTANQVNETSISLAGRVLFDFDTGTIINQRNTSNRVVESLQDGWFRISFTRDNTHPLDRAWQVTMCDDDATDARSNQTYLGDGTGTVLVALPQVVNNVTFGGTPIITTTSSSLTRNADVLTVTGAQDVIGQESGWIYVEVDVSKLDFDAHILRLDDGGTSNFITIRKLSTNEIRCVITSTTSSGTVNLSSASVTTGLAKIAYIYKSGGISISVNGATPVTVSGTFSFGTALNRIFVGVNVSTSEWNDTIYRTAIGIGTLTEQQAIELTTT